MYIFSFLMLSKQKKSIILLFIILKRDNIFVYNTLSKAF